MKYFVNKGQTAKIESVVFTDDGLTTANLNGSSIRFMLKKNPADPDSQALLTKNIGSGIDITNATGGICQVTLTAADTNNLSYLSLYFEILVKLADGTYIRTGMHEIVLNKTLINNLN